MGYAYKPAKVEEPKTACARVDNVNVSWKDVANVCANVRGRRADAALEFLSEAADGERPVRYFNYNKRRGHVGRLGGKKGGWPVKSARIVRDVLANAIANADSRGLGACKIVHIQANKQLVYNRMSPKGRRIRQDLETAFVEIVLREIAGREKAKATTAQTAKKADGKKEAKVEEAKKGGVAKKAEAKVADEKKDVKVDEAKKAEVKREVKAEEKVEEAKKAEAKSEEKEIDAAANEKKEEAKKVETPKIEQKV